LAQLRQDYDKYVNQQAAVLVVGPEGRDKFQDYWQEEDLPFTGLPDPKGRVLKLFGQEVNLFKFGRMPAQVIVDKQGIARYVHYGKSMQDIPSNEELLGLLESLNIKEQVS
jgi:peroxiredoxin